MLRVTWLLCWLGLWLQWWVTLGLVRSQGRGVAAAAVVFLSYFTVLTNLLAAGVLTAEVMGWWVGRRWWPSAVSAVAMYLGVVCAVYFLLLSDVWGADRGAVGGEWAAALRDAGAVRGLVVGFCREGTGGVESGGVVDGVPGGVCGGDAGAGVGGGSLSVLVCGCAGAGVGAGAAELGRFHAGVSAGGLGGDRGGPVAGKARAPA